MVDLDAGFHETPTASEGPAARKEQGITKIVLAALAIGLAVVPTSSGAERGALALNGVLSMTSTLGSCPPEAPPEATVCASRVGDGVVRGLGAVSERYTYFIVESACGTGDRVLETTARFEVAGKGELQLALARIEDCLPSALDATGPFTVTGGTGIYAGASGTGVVVHKAQYTPSGSAGTDTWTGTLDVPGLEFDLTPPALSGTANKTVRAPRRAKRVRVSYRVRATDQVDGSRPVVCKPRSGSRFRIGRTVVKCSATDNSGNSATGRFSIVVKRRR